MLSSKTRRKCAPKLSLWYLCLAFCLTQPEFLSCLLPVSSHLNANNDTSIKKQKYSVLSILLQDLKKKYREVVKFLCLAAMERQKITTEPLPELCTQVLNLRELQATPKTKILQGSLPGKFPHIRINHNKSFPQSRYRANSFCLRFTTSRILCFWEGAQCLHE